MAVTVTADVRQHACVCRLNRGPPESTTYAAAPADARALRHEYGSRQRGKCVVDPRLTTRQCSLVAVVTVPNIECSRLRRMSQEYLAGRVSIVVGDITRLDVDAIVNAAN